MTIIVWDGSTLATDCAATDGSAKWQTQKAWYWLGEILSGAGPLHTILEMREWYKGGRIPDKLPKVQLGPHWCHFVVVGAGGLQRYEQSPIPIEHGYDACAFGEGRDFALGALAMGASAAQAVAVCNQLVPSCGMGVHEYTYVGVVS